MAFYRDYYDYTWQDAEVKTTFGCRVLALRVALGGGNGEGNTHRSNGVMHREVTNQSNGVTHREVMGR